MGRFCLIFILLSAVVNHIEMVIVTVNEGQLNGRVVPHAKIGRYYSFQGIRYAQAPVGTKRFKDPVPIGPWQGVKNATYEGDICMQYIRQFRLYPPGQSEDCLFLNVYTPTLNKNARLAVMFWIHGGAFSFGSSKSSTYGPYFLMETNIVLVTVNYRLGALGFLNLGTRDVPGNAGLKDQNLALKWVKNNIIHFGGDPERITIIGQSAGSASVFYHMLSPMSRGLFDKAIGMSGVPFCEWAYTYRLEDRSFALGNQLGNNTHDPNEMLAFLQSVPAKELINKFPTVIDMEKNYDYGLKMTAFQPCPEGDFGQERFLEEATVDALEAGHIARVPVLTGYTTQECLILIPEMIESNIPGKHDAMHDLFIPREVMYDGTNVTNRAYYARKIFKYYFKDAKSVNFTNVDVLTEYMSDEVFVYSINRFLKYIVPLVDKAYLYVDDLNTLRNRLTIFGVPFGIKGVSHTDDYKYLFSSMTDILLPPQLPSIKKDIEQFVTLFTNFAKYGNPTPPGLFNITWPEYNLRTKPYMIINRTLTTSTNPDSDDVAFWTGIYREAGVRLY